MARIINIYDYKNIIQNSFNRTFLDYQQMFSTHYPAASHGGLNEATQTYHFCHNLVNEINNEPEENGTYASASMEVPIGNGKRIDAIVVAPNIRSVFYIESKRLRAGTRTQKNKVLSDLNKILEAGRAKLLENIYINDDSVTEYMICLTDVWLSQSKNPRSIPHWWCGNNKTEKQLVGNFHRDLIKKTEPTFVDEANKIWKGWNIGQQFIHRFSANAEYAKNRKSLEQYCILCGFAQLP